MTQLHVIPPPDIVPTADNTRCEAWERCPLLYKFRHVDGLASRGTKPALSFGGLVHDGLRIWYEAKDAGAVLDHMSTADYVDVEGDHRTRGRAMTTLVDYMSFYIDEPWERVLLTETPFSITTHDGFRYGGKLDLVVLWKGALWVVDHKTTSRAGAAWWVQFENSPQMAGYVWAASQLQGAPVRGVIINRILVHKAKKPPEEEFTRKPLFFPEWKLDEWRSMRIDTYKEMANAHLTNRFRPRWDNCINKYGTCAFHSVCTAPPQSRDEILAAQFEHKPWDWMEEDE